MTPVSADLVAQAILLGALVGGVAYLVYDFYSGPPSSMT